MRQALLALALGLLLALPAAAADGLSAARAAQREGRYSEAITLLDRHLAAAPADLSALRLRAECYQYLGNLARAEADLRAGLAHAPDSPELLEGLGWLSIFKKDFKAAESHLRRALSLDGENFWIRLNLAHALLLQGREAEAIQLYCALLETDLRETVGPAMAKDFAKLSQRGISHPRFEALADQFSSHCGLGLVPPEDCKLPE